MNTQKPKRAKPKNPILLTRGLVREKELLAMLPFGPSLLRRMIAEQRFPEPVKLSTRTKVWRIDSVEAWLEKLGQGAA